MRFTLAFLLVSVLAPTGYTADKADDLIKSAATELKANRADHAIRMLREAIELDPKNAQAHFLLGVALDQTGKFTEAIAALTKVLELDPKNAEALDRRGNACFKAGLIEESARDFDQYIKVVPDAANGHWRRGITLYYAKRYDDGRKQFEGYEKVDTNDVENAVWHFLCVARKDGVAKARQSLLKIGRDGRVPMMEVYSLYAGKSKPEDVLSVAQAGDPDKQSLNSRLFYAHLYLGLYYEVEGKPDLALKHLSESAEHRIGHYMWDVARVHRDLLKMQR